MNIRISRIVLLIGLAACGSDPTTMGMTPNAPVLDMVASPLNSNPIELKGSGQAGATVSVRGGANSPETTTIGTDGKFTISVRLRENVENVLLISQSASGEESTTTTLRITHDNISPETPAIDPISTPTRRTKIALRGRAEANSKISITGGSSPVETTTEADGTFSAELDLLNTIAAITENNLSVIASDTAGNLSSAAVATIVHNPNLALDAPLMMSPQSFTSNETIELRGITEPAVMVQILGGAEAATGAAGVDGSFAINVRLERNTVNALSVFAIIPATGLASPPAILVITHDNIGPDAPVCDPIASPTGATNVRLRGTTEALASITVRGGANEVSTNADINGSFDIQVSLTENTINGLSVVAADLAGNQSAATLIAIEQDSSLPVPVIVDPVISPTAEELVTISGETEANATVEITGGASPSSVVAGADGRFVASVLLNTNARNELHVMRMSSMVDTLVVIVHDNIAPEPPQLNPLPSPTNQTTLLVSGTVEASARVAITGTLSSVSVTAGLDGRFSIAVTISADVSTTITAIATDRAGNVSTPATLSVAHSSAIPDAPVLDETNPAPTHQTTFVVTGHVTAPRENIQIHITGGAIPASGLADISTGAFSIEVTLNANATNELHVRSLEGEIESPPAIINIAHDDVAPGAPTSASITVEETPPLSTCLLRPTLTVQGAMGSVEGSSRVRVTNLTTMSSWSTNATAAGTFSVDVNACSGEILSLVAIDAAGNVSSATESNVN